jgi:hypothetical protein
MTRVTFYEPDGGYTPEIVFDVLDLVSTSMPREVINRWTRLELMVAYDWAMREHLHASDCPVRRRERPWFLAEVGRACWNGCEEITREDEAARVIRGAAQ